MRTASREAMCAHAIYFLIASLRAASAMNDTKNQRTHYSFKQKKGSDSDSEMQLTGHNLVESTEVDGVGQSRRHRLLATVHRHLGEEARFRSHGCLC